MVPLPVISSDQHRDDVTETEFRLLSCHELLGERMC